MSIRIGAKADADCLGPVLEPDDKRPTPRPESNYIPQCTERQAGRRGDLRPRVFHRAKKLSTNALRARAESLGFRLFGWGFAFFGGWFGLGVVRIAAEPRDGLPGFLCRLGPRIGVDDILVGADDIRRPSVWVGLELHGRFQLRLGVGFHRARRYGRLFGLCGRPFGFDFYGWLARFALCGWLARPAPAGKCGGLGRFARRGRGFRQFGCE